MVAFFFLSRRKRSFSSLLDARHFSFSLYATGAWSWSLEGESLSKSVCGFFKRNCLGPQLFLPPTESSLVCAARSYGDLSCCHWNPGQEALVWVTLVWVTLVWVWDSSFPRYPSPFLPTMRGYETSSFCLSIPPTSVDGCVFFNSTVVAFPFNLISDGSE